MKTTIYFIRHGQVDNPKNILYGRLPRFGLSTIGHRQINDLINILKGKNIAAIYTSPLLRTRQTAQILGKSLGLLPISSKYLIETEAVYKGMSADLFREKIEPYLYESKHIKKGQESISSQEERMSKFINMAKKRHKGDKIIAVSHGDPIMIVKAKLEKNKFTYQYKKNHYIQKGECFVLTIEDDSYIWTKLIS